MRRLSWERISNDRISSGSVLPDGIQPEDRDEEGNSLLHYAVAAENVELCIALVNLGWHPLHRNARGESPIDFALSRGLEEIAEDLRAIAMRSGFDEDQPSTIPQGQRSINGDEIVMRRPDFEPHPDPYENHSQRIMQPAVGTFEPTTITADPDAVDWEFPPDIAGESSTTNNVTSPPKSRDPSSWGVQSELQNGTAKHDESCFMISEQELRALLEQNRQSLLELFMNEKFQERHPNVCRPTKSTRVPSLPSLYALMRTAFLASTEGTLRLIQNTKDAVVSIPFVIDYRRSEKIDAKFYKNRQLMELSRCVESSFAQGESHTQT